MRVKLRNNWFAPDNTLYLKGDGVEIPDDLAGSLPRTATFAEGMDTRLKPVRHPAETLRDHDPRRAATDAEGRINEAVNETHRTEAKQEAINLRMAKARAARKSQTKDE